MTEEDRSPSQHSPARRRWLWIVLFSAVLGVLGYRTWGPDPAKPKPPASDTPSQAEPQPQGPRLRVSVWSDGTPVRGAKVTLEGQGCQGRERTDSEGLARIDGCPAGVWELTVEAAGYVRAARSLQLDPSGRLEKVDLEPGERLEGKVLDEAGRPLPGVTITARVLGPSAAAAGGTTTKPWLALTAPDGTFSIDSLPIQTIVLDVSDGGAHEPTSLTDISLPSDPLVITLRRTASLSGRVSNADGEAVAGARVVLAGSGVWPARVTESEPTGEFTFASVPEGVYELRAELDTQVSVPLEGVTVQPGSHARVELKLTEGATLRGRVRAATSGTALPAQVQVAEEALSGRERTVQAGADGRFEVAGLRALPHRVTVQSPGYVAEQRWITPGQQLASFDLLRAAGVSGRVEDSDGQPVAHANIEVRGRSITGKPVLMVGPIQEAPPLTEATSPGLGSATPSSLGVTSGAVPRVPILPLAGGSGDPGDFGFQSDDSGAFRIEGLPPGQLTFTARKAGMSAGHSAKLQLKPGSKLDEVRITLPAGVTLEGRVEDARGEPVAHVRVDLVTDGDLPRSTTTSAEGRFVFESARGNCTLWARPFGAPATRLSGKARELAEQDILLTLESNTDSLDGRVLDADGQPVEAASVHLEATQSHGYSPTVLSAPDGTFEFQALPPPPYELRVEHPDFSPSAVQTIESTRDAIEVQLLRGARVFGHVHDAVTDAPLSAASVHIHVGGVARSARVQRDGSFELAHLPEGAYHLTAEANGYVTESVDGELGTGRNADTALRIALMKAASISGEVVDRLGRTVWNAQVAVGVPPDWAHATRSDHAGHFHLQGVQEGEHVVSARHGALTATSADSVRVVEGEDSPGALIRLPGIAEENEPVSEPPPRPSSHASALLAIGMRGSSVVIERVAPETSAARAGLREGDVLLAVDGEPVRSAAQARGMLALAPASGRRTRTLEVRREQKVVQLRVR